jgi:hypothetical protein
MKINHFILFASMLFAVSCSKNDDTNTQPSQSDNYLTTSNGSTWNYQQVDSSSGTAISSNYIITSTSKDTSINGRSYHVYNNSAGGNRYLNLSGNDYYQFDSLSFGAVKGVFEWLYLKDNAAAGTTWNQSQMFNIPGFPIPVPVKMDNNIAERNLTMTVNGITYNDVMHVSSSLSSSLIPSGLISSINNYYAPKVGLIEGSTKLKLNATGLDSVSINISVKLVNSSLK